MNSIGCATINPSTDLEWLRVRMREGDAVYSIPYTHIKKGVRVIHTPQNWLKPTVHRTHAKTQCVSHSSNVSFRFISFHNLNSHEDPKPLFSSCYSFHLMFSVDRRGTDETDNRTCRHRRLSFACASVFCVRCGCHRHNIWTAGMCLGMRVCVCRCAATLNR